MSIKLNINSPTKSSHAKIYYYGTGRDKTSVARVFMCKGTGQFSINGRSIEEYFKRKTFKMIVMQPLNVVDMANNFDFKINVQGGGNSGQADAVRLGIARALLDFDEENLKPLLRGAGLLTRDKRKVERKKCGLRKARKKEQYSKR